MHHSSKPPSKEFLERFNAPLSDDVRKKAAEVQPLGATGEFPRGKIEPSDEGEIRFAVGADQETQTVVLDFGKPVAWIGMTPEQAVEIAQSLIEKARLVSKTPLTVTL